MEINKQNYIKDLYNSIEFYFFEKDYSFNHTERILCLIFKGIFDDDEIQRLMIRYLVNK